MKKTFPLQVTGKDSQRVLESIKNEVRKYVQREQKKTPPEGFNRWEFCCRVGVDKTAPQDRRLSEVIASIDTVAKAGNPQVYVEIVANPIHRMTAETEAPGSDAPVGESRLPDRPD
jgi:hypothetical protein